MIRTYSVTSRDKLVIFWEAQIYKRLIKVYFIPDFIPTASSQQAPKATSVQPMLALCFSLLLSYISLLNVMVSVSQNNLEDSDGQSRRIMFPEKILEI